MSGTISAHLSPTPRDCKTFRAGVALNPVRRQRVCVWLTEALLRLSGMTRLTRGAVYRGSNDPFKPKTRSALPFLNDLYGSKAFSPVQELVIASKRWY